MIRDINEVAESGNYCDSKSKLDFVFYLIVLFFLDSSLALGQSLNVTVINIFRNNLPACQAQLTLNQNNKIIQHGITDSLGTYSFIGLDSACYDVKIELAPYPNHFYYNICIDSLKKDVILFVDFDVSSLGLSEKQYKYFRFFDLDTAKHLEMKSLRFIDGSYRGLEKVPNSISKMSNIYMLHLEGNKLKKIPKAVFRNKKLKLLDLRYNPIDAKSIKTYRQKRKDLNIVW